jgi:mannose-6-phosphate isomerase-like protein (cupin superfamily)
MTFRVMAVRTSSRGADHGNLAASFILVDMPPGAAVRLHRHAYEEVFIIQEGKATFTIGSTTLEAHAGQIIVVPTGIAHGFANTGEQQLKQLDTHMTRTILTEWLED